MTQTNKAQQAREGSFGFLLQTVARQINLQMKDRLAEQGIDLKVFSSLMMLAEQDGINQRNLGRKLGYPDYFTSRNIDYLVDSGFAERRPDPKSRRSFLIYLTDKGREKASKLPKFVETCNDGFLAPLSKSERATIIKLLQKMMGIAPI